MGKVSNRIKLQIFYTNYDRWYITFIKSTLLSKITHTASESAAYEFTTLTVSTSKVFVWLIRN